MIRHAEGAKSAGLARVRASRGIGFLDVLARRRRKAGQVGERGQHRALRAAGERPGAPPREGDDRNRYCDRDVRCLVLWFDGRGVALRAVCLSDRWGGRRG